jgi:protein-S-isoprenylcysteine O-methyltransferase Ste14
LLKRNSIARRGIPEAEVNHLDRVVWRHRNIVAGLPVAAALASTYYEVESEVVVWLLAVTLVGVGVAVRTWASCHCWYAQRRPRSLATTGPYSMVRHPLYIGNLLILAGAIVASEVVWLLPLAMAWAFLVYARVARHEERQLAARYGEEWLRYCRQVPRWLPRPRRAAGQSDRVEEGAGDLAAACRRQALNFLILVPFVVKELNAFGLGHP